MARAHLIPAAIGLLVAFVGFRVECAAAGRDSAKGRIVVLMVWDGLRPDLVNEKDTPNLYALENRGVRFEHHHSIFPTVTMVNAAALATGGDAGATGILGDSMYLAPVLDAKKIESNPVLSPIIDAPIDLENSHYLAALDGPDAFDGHLLGLATIAAEVRRDGGYAAVIGKQGPTFLFDNGAAEGVDSSAHNYLFVADDMAAPPAAEAELAGAPAIKRADFATVGARDAWFAQLVADRALPAAKQAAANGHPAIVVFWQHNPDSVQHHAGLGTAPAIEALHQCDANLARVEGALSALGIAERTDLMVVSDHGFATIRLQISLSDLLVAAGVKKSAESTEVVVAPNGGYDLVYLSRNDFPSPEARRLALVRIADFVEAQEWCGPIFTIRPVAGANPSAADYLGWIPGTFSEGVIGIRDSARAPDLIVSFREIPDADNHDLTGPENPAFALGAHGQQATPNLSAKLVNPVQGLVYSDVGSPMFTTGMGMHGAAGSREIHNFCAATGPGFRRHFVDADPTSNLDAAATIRELLHVPQPTASSGRVMSEALTKRVAPMGSASQFVETAYLPLQGGEVVTELRFSRFDGRNYLDDAKVSHAPLGASP
jgi:arylsulfatase A-like enzyme